MDEGRKLQRITRTAKDPVKLRRAITAFSTWSLAKLRDHLVSRMAAVSVLIETMRRILRDGKVYWQFFTSAKARRRLGCCSARRLSLVRIR